MVSVERCSRNLSPADISSPDADSAEAAIEKLRRTFPEPNRFATVDAFDGMQVGQWARHVLTNLGPLQLLINNAGLMHTPAPLWEKLEGSVVEVRTASAIGIVHLQPSY